VSALACLSVPGCRLPLPVLESLAFPRDGLPCAVADLRSRTGADELLLVSTCERTEVYGLWTGGAQEPAPLDTLARALAASRGVPVGVVTASCDRFTGSDAAGHLLRVASGLESFVLGESDIVGQVRAAADASRAAGACGPELERLVAAAVHTSRRVHRSTSFGEGGRSVAAAAVALAAEAAGGDLRDRRVVVVGAGRVATDVAGGAGRLGAAVTVCNRTTRHADRFAASGASVVDLGRLPEALRTADVAIFGTAAPHRLVEARTLARIRTGAPGLLVLDLCVPRNVDPDVRGLPGVRLVDLADLRATGAAGSDALARDAARAAAVVEAELDRHGRASAHRSAAAAVRRLRQDLDACAERQAGLAARGVPEPLRPDVEDRVRRAVRRLADGPTRRLLEAAEAGDGALVELLSGLFAAEGQPPARSSR